MSKASESRHPLVGLSVELIRLNGRMKALFAGARRSEGLGDSELAVLSAVGGGAEAPAKRPAPAWAAPHRAVRRALPHGPGGWRASGLPR